MRVLHVSGPCSGGIKKHIEQLRDGLTALGVCSQVAPTGSASPAHVAALVRVIRRDRVDLVHCHGFQGGAVGRTAAMAAGVPVVMTIHNTLQVEGLINRGAVVAELLLRTRTRTWVAVSKFLRDWALDALHLPPERVELVYNGISVPGKLPQRPRGRLVGTVARLVPGKGIATLLRALALLPGVDGLIVGEGPQRRELEALSEKLGVSGRVRFTGYCDQVGPMLDQMQVFVLPTLSEGLGVSLMEAMARGVPVVASAVGGVPELVIDGVSGLLAPPDAPVELAAAIGRVLDFPDLAQQLRQGALNRLAECFCLEAMLTGNYRVYRSLLDA